MIFITPFEVKFKIPVDHQELIQIILNIQKNLREIENKELPVFKQAINVALGEKVFKTAYATLQRRNALQSAGIEQKNTINLKLNKYECIWLYWFLTKEAGDLPLDSLAVNRIGPYIATYLPKDNDNYGSEVQ